MSNGSGRGRDGAPCGRRRGARPGAGRCGRRPARAALLVVATLLAALLAAAPAAGPALAADAAPPLRLDGDDARAPLAGHVEVLRDAAGTMGWRAVAADDDGFRPIPGNFNVGYTGSGAWWLRFTVEPGAGAGGEWWLTPGAPFTDLIDVYGPLPPAGTEEPVHTRVGAALPVASRELPLPRSAVRIDLRPGEPQTILVRLAGTRSIGARPILWRLPAFLRSVAVSTVTFSTLIGAALFAAVGAFLFGIWLRDVRFVWYGGYVGATALVFAANNGFVAVLLDWLSPTAFLRLHGVIGSLSIMSAAFLVLTIFPVPRRLRALGWAIGGVGVLAAAAAVLSTVGYYGMTAPYVMAGVLLITFSAPFLALRQVLLRAPMAIWNFIGFTSYGVASLWFALSALGLVPLTFFSVWGPQLIAGLHMVLTFGFLATTVRAGGRERRRLEGELLEASRHNERVLEAAVGQRTVALEAEVAARRNAESALVVALREQRHFLVVVSHEFRTPLATIRAAIATIEQVAVDLDRDVRHEAAKIGRAVTRLVTLIDTFLVDASLERSTNKLQREPLDLAGLVAELCDEHAAQARRRIRVEGSAPPVVGDAVLLRTALDNLLGNAAKYSSGDVEVRLSERDGGIAVAVRDHGEGIPPEDLDYVFERYYRSGSALSRPGAGVGLNIVRSIADLHGGTVSVRSRVGEGSTFEIWLPAALGRRG